MQWSLSYSQCSKTQLIVLFFPEETAHIQVQKWTAQTHMHVYTDKVTVSESERNRQREKQGWGEEREKGHVDRVMVADTEVHSAVRVRSWGWSWRHRPGSVCRCPLTAPLTFIPPPLPHCPSCPACCPPIGLRGGGGTAGLHQRPGAVRGSGPDAGTQQSLTQERDREGAETDSFKKAVQTHPFSGKGHQQNKTFHSPPQTSIMPASHPTNQTRFFSPLACFSRSPSSPSFSAYSQWPPWVCEQER